MTLAHVSVTNKNALILSYGTKILATVHVENIKIVHVLMSSTTNHVIVHVQKNVLMIGFKIQRLAIVSALRTNANLHSVGMKNSAIVHVSSETADLALFSIKLFVNAFVMRIKNSVVLKTGDSTTNPVNVHAMKNSVIHLWNSMRDFVIVHASKETVDLDSNSISIYVDVFAIRMSAVYQIGSLTVKLADVSVNNKIVQIHMNGIVKIATVHASIKVASFQNFGIKRNAIVYVHQIGHVQNHGLLIQTLANVDVQSLWTVHNLTHGMIKLVTAHVLIKIVHYPKYLMKNPAVVHVHLVGLVHIHGLSILKLVNVFVVRSWIVHLHFNGIIEFVIAHVQIKIAHYLTF